MNKRSAQVSGLGTVVLVTTLLALAPTPALAYLDPGSGSMLFQVLIAALVGIGFTIRRLRAIVFGWFRRPTEPREKD
jgi:hypothetical protein